VEKVRYRVGGIQYDLDETDPGVDWDQAKCKGLSDTFFPPLPEGTPAERDEIAARTLELEKQAVAICRSGCRLMRECQAEWSSLPTPFQQYGVWWGTTPADRSQLVVERVDQGDLG
jgi:hypothetical protein